MLGEHIEFECWQD